MLLFGFSSTGMSIYLHYCCGKLDKISLTSQKNQSCAKDLNGISNKRSCDDKHLEFKLKADQEPSAKWIQAFKLLTGPALSSSYHYITWQPQNKPVNDIATGPPLTASPLPLFIKNRVFRI